MINRNLFVTCKGFGYNKVSRRTQKCCSHLWSFFFLYNLYVSVGYIYGNFFYIIYTFLFGYNTTSAYMVIAFDPSNSNNNKEVVAYSQMIKSESLNFLVWNLIGSPVITGLHQTNVYPHDIFWCESVASPKSTLVICFVESK